MILFAAGCKKMQPIGKGAMTRETIDDAGLSRNREGIPKITPLQGGGLVLNGVRDTQMT
jgi:hypothetical protein